MTWCQTWIADYGLSSTELHLSDIQGKRVERISPMLPTVHLHGCNSFFDWAALVGSEYIELDWGSWATGLSKTQVLRIIDHSYADTELSDELNAFIQSLDEGKTYVLIAEEY